MAGSRLPSLLWILLCFLRRLWTPVRSRLKLTEVTSSIFLESWDGHSMYRKGGVIFATLGPGSAGTSVTWPATENKLMALTMMAHLSISFYQIITILSQLNLCKSKEYGKKIENDLECLEIPCESHKERYSINRNYVGLIKNILPAWWPPRGAPAYRWPTALSYCSGTFEEELVEVEKLLFHLHKFVLKEEMLLAIRA